MGGQAALSSIGSKPHSPVQIIIFGEQFDALVDTITSKSSISDGIRYHLKVVTPMTSQQLFRMGNGKLRSLSDVVQCRLGLETADT